MSIKQEKLQKLSLGGSLIAAISASLCCLGPLVVALMGVGGFAASSFFHKYRLVFISVTVIFLAFAWYLQWKKSKEVCGEEGKCEITSSSKWNKAILIMATIFVVGFTAFPQLSSFALNLNAPTVTGQNLAGVTLNVKIPSMTCVACTVAIKKSLLKKTGILDANINYETKSGTIVYDKEKVSEQEIMDAITATGFKPEAYSSLANQSCPSCGTAVKPGGSCCSINFSRKK